MTEQTTKPAIKPDPLYQMLRHEDVDAFNASRDTMDTSHLKSVREGMVYATAKAIHLGRSTQVWEIKTTSEENVLINVSRMTLAVVDKK